MEARDLQRVKEMFEITARTAKFDLQKEVCSRLRRLSQACAKVGNVQGEAALLAGADDIEHMAIS